MAKSKKSLPEISVNAQTHPELVAVTKRALNLRSQIAELETQEKTSKARIAELAEGVRRTEEREKSNYIGVVKITDEEMAPAQVQHKMCNAALAITEGETLDHHFTSARPMLWEKDMVITGISNPDALLTELREKGQNPWDLLELKVKTGVDRALESSPNVIKEEAFLPVEGFLATLNEIKHTLSPEAKEYLSKYLETVLKVTVSLGHK
jgi:hypothetical protein